MQSKITDRGVLPIHLGGAGVCAALLATGWFMGLGPMLAETEQESSVIEHANQVQQEARLNKTRLEALNAQLDQVQKELDDKPVSLQPASQINPLLAELARWADEQRLNVTGTTAGQPVALTYYDYVPISLSGEGAYADLLGFFKRLHSERGDLGVVAFNANRLPDGAGISYELQLAWYVSSEEAGKGEATAAVTTK